MTNPSVGPIFWGAAAVAAISVVTLLVGWTLLLGTAPHRKVALPMVWVSVSLLATSAIVLILILTQA